MNPIELEFCREWVRDRKLDMLHKCFYTSNEGYQILETYTNTFEGINEGFKNEDDNLFFKGVIIFGGRNV